MNPTILPITKLFITETKKYCGQQYYFTAGKLKSNNAVSGKS